MGDNRHRVALHTDHLRQDFLRQRQTFAAGPIARMQQRARQVRFDRVRRIACGGLLGRTASLTRSPGLSLQQLTMHER
jgi:hypothetical protein